MNNDAKYFRQEGLINTKLDNEMVILSIENGNYYGLNEVASRIWSLLATPMTRGDICSKLAIEFSVNTEQCSADVVYFLNDLEKNNLIVSRQ